MAALFGVMLSDPHAELARLWARVHAAERKGIDCAAARSLLCRPPIDAKQAQDPTVQKYFFRKRAGESAGAPRQLAATWAAACAENRAKASAWLHSQAG